MYPSTKNVKAGDVPPPGAGFVTVTFALPATATSLAGIAAEIFVALTKVVGSALPLRFTTDFASKPVPFTVRVKPAPPAVALAGESEVIVKFEGLLIVKD